MTGSIFQQSRRPFLRAPRLDPERWRLRRWLRVDPHRRPSPFNSGRDAQVAYTRGSTTFIRPPSISPGNMPSLPDSYSLVQLDNLSVRIEDSGVSGQC
jgi:hypothetical protein